MTFLNKQAKYFYVQNLENTVKLQHTNRHVCMVNKRLAILCKDNIITTYERTYDHTGQIGIELYDIKTVYEPNYIRICAAFMWSAIL